MLSLPQSPTPCDGFLQDIWQRDGVSADHGAYGTMAILAFRCRGRWYLAVKIRGAAHARRLALHPFAVASHAAALSTMVERSPLAEKAQLLCRGLVTRRVEIGA